MGVSFKANMKRIIFLLVTAAVLCGQSRESVVKRDLILAPNEVYYQSEVQVARRYAVIIGVSSYANGPEEAASRALEWNPKDARAYLFRSDSRQLTMIRKLKAVVR